MWVDNGHFKQYFSECLRWNLGEKIAGKIHFHSISRSAYQKEDRNLISEKYVFDEFLTIYEGLQKEHRFCLLPCFFSKHVLCCMLYEFIYVVFLSL